MKSNKFLAMICVTAVLALSLPMWCMAGEDGQNPVMNFVGNYGWARATMEIAAKGDDMADVAVLWAGSAFEYTEWTMSGILDTDTLTVSYSDCTKKIVTFDDTSKDTGEPAQETIEYTGGTGTITFGEGGTLVWNDDQEQIAKDAVFEYFLLPAETEDASAAAPADMEGEAAPAPADVEGEAAPVPADEGTFSANMTSHDKYIMYVGTNDKDTFGPVYPFDKAKELANNICARYTDGYTQIDAKGGWIDDNGMLTQEDTLIYIFYDATEEQLQNIMDELIALLHQSSILIEKQPALYSFYSGS